MVLGRVLCGNIAAPKRRIIMSTMHISCPYEAEINEFESNIDDYHFGRKTRAAVLTLARTHKPQVKFDGKLGAAIHVSWALNVITQNNPTSMKIKALNNVFSDYISNSKWK